MTESLWCEQLQGETTTWTSIYQKQREHQLVSLFPREQWALSQRLLRDIPGPHILKILQENIRDEIGVYLESKTFDTIDQLAHTAQTIETGMKPASKQSSFPAVQATQQAPPPISGRQPAAINQRPYVPPAFGQGVYESQSKGAVARENVKTCFYCGKIRLIRRDSPKKLRETQSAAPRRPD